MSYVFSLLVVVNAAVLGYFLLVPQSDSKGLEEAKATLQAPVAFEDNSSKLPPEIGKK